MDGGKNMKNKCFANKGRRCAVTTYDGCPKKCSFYKTKEEFIKEFLKSKKILDKKGMAAKYRKINTVFDEMCRKICK